MNKSLLNTISRVTDESDMTHKEDQNKISVLVAEPVPEFLNDDESSEIVSEFCLNCQTEIELLWDVKVHGYKAYCPHCGERLMLCDECLHTQGETNICDYNINYDTCRHNNAPQIRRGE